MPLDVTINIVAPVSLADFTRRTLIVPEVRQADTAGIIGELSQRLHQEGCVPDVLPFYHTAVNQELFSNSALPCGIAIPHARLGAVKHLTYALGRCVEPVVWGAKGTSRVQLVFLLAVPATDAAGYLHLLARLARLAQQPDTVGKLVAAPGAKEILRILQNCKIRQG